MRGSKAYGDPLGVSNDDRHIPEDYDWQAEVDQLLINDWRWRSSPLLYCGPEIAFAESDWEYSKGAGAQQIVESISARLGDAEVGSPSGDYGIIIIRVLVLDDDQVSFLEYPVEGAKTFSLQPGDYRERLWYFNLVGNFLFLPFKVSEINSNSLIDYLIYMARVEEKNKHYFHGLNYGKLLATLAVIMRSIVREISEEVLTEDQRSRNICLDMYLKRALGTYAVLEGMMTACVRDCVRIADEGELE